MTDFSKRVLKPFAASGSMVVVEGRRVLVRRTTVGLPTPNPDGSQSVLKVAVPVMFKTPDDANQWLSNGTLVDLERQLGEQVLYLELASKEAIPRPGSVTGAAVVTFGQSAPSQAADGDRQP